MKRCPTCKNKRFLVRDDGKSLYQCPKCNINGKYKPIEITVCSGCGKPYTEDDAKVIGVKYHDCGCPAGTANQLIEQNDPISTEERLVATLRSIFSDIKKISKKPNFSEASVDRIDGNFRIKINISKIRNIE